jgi:two-component system, chemotaxis family, CheB/CheR fusion protein
MQTSAAEFHRQLRSLFAVLRILVRQSSQRRDSVEDYSAHLEGRVGALARVHEMLMRAPHEGVDLQEIVCGELLAQTVPDEKYSIGGPEIRIAREPAAALGLAFHELSVNAMTHGAFAAPHGRVEVRWSIRGENGGSWLRIQWREHDVGGTTKPSHKGFGMELVERMLPYELSARTTVDFASDGVRVQLLIPQAAATPIWRHGPADSQ